MAVDPKKNRKWVKFTVGSKTYQTRMANSQTQGSLFALMGYTDVGENPAKDAEEVTRAFALENGLLIPMTAEGRVGNRAVYRKIYVPTPKIEETIKSAAGKTTGNAQVIKVRGQKRRIII